MGSKRRRAEEEEVVAVAAETMRGPREDEKADAVGGWTALDRPVKTWRRLGATNTGVDINDVSNMMQRCVLKRRSSNDDEKFKEEEEQHTIRSLFNQVRWADPLVWTSITTRAELPHPLVLQLYLKTRWRGCKVTQKLIENLRLLLTLVNKQQFE
jgi:hypothetical protein